MSDIRELGSIGLVLGAIIGLLVALRSGTLIQGSVLDRLERRYEAELQGKDREIDRWRAACERSEEGLATALRSNELLASQNDRLASGVELTERLIEALRSKVTP